MFLSDDITKEGNPVLREKCKEVTLPLSNDDLETLKGLHEYELISQIDELVKKYKIRPGVGIAAPQVGVAKRMCAIRFTGEKTVGYKLVNPRILNHSSKQTFAPEGCLSVPQDHEDGIPRWESITVTATNCCN